jgi:ribosomal-protein-alanine N-acetyltransferase
MYKKRIYETKRLLLKILDKNSFIEVTDYYKRNINFKTEFEPKRNKNFLTSELQKKQLEDEMLKFERGNMLKLWIFKKDKPQKIIGFFSFSNIIRAAFLSCFLGYRLDEKEVNNGYMTEAIRKGIEIIFNDYKLHRIEANIMPKNKASLSVVKKLGFTSEGISKNYLNINGKWEDHIHMVLLNKKLE